MLLKTGPWKLSDGYPPSNGKKVFSCFHCGGGSTMGYKLAGFEVLGGVEIDPEMMAIYRANHKPKHSYLMGVQEFKNIPNEQLPKELFELDIFDGSPPCSSFSMAGSREKKWGGAHKFREGQAVQHLDDLFFDFIDIAKKLQPKIVVAENVKGLIQGNARGYVKQIFAAFKDAGYSCQLFLLNASRMGVPQMRERTFFIASRIDLKLPQLNLDFNENTVSAKTAFVGASNAGELLTPLFSSYWKRIRPGVGLGEIGKYNQWKKLHPDRPAFTQTSTIRLMHWDSPRKLSDQECIRIQSFPDDYNFLKQDTGYVCGMSVPPFMMQRVANQIGAQLLTNSAE